MGDKSKIQWTDATWNPIAGCSIISPGCKNCYAMKVAHRLSSIPATAEKYQGLTTLYPTGRGQSEGAADGEEPAMPGNRAHKKPKPVWTGEVRFNEETLTQPLRWKRPRMIFVNSMSDLFHESVPDEWIDKIFAVMALCQQHTFQILTKRPERMQAYVAKRLDKQGRHEAMTYAALMAATGRWNTPALDLRYWPIPNVWLGVSAERQQEADERIPLLLDTPSAIRFVSCEPLLGPVNIFRNFHCDLCGGTGQLARWPKGKCHVCKGKGEIPGISTDPVFGNPLTPMRFIDWVIVGGESGPGARPMHPNWARSLRDQCQAAGVPFFFKQWGEWAPVLYLDQNNVPHLNLTTDKRETILTSETGEKINMRRLGTPAAGRLLAGREWNEMPTSCRKSHSC